MINKLRMAERLAQDTAQHRQSTDPQTQRDNKAKHEADKLQYEKDLKIYNDDTAAYEKALREYENEVGKIKAEEKRVADEKQKAADDTAAAKLAIQEQRQPFQNTITGLEKSRTDALTAKDTLYWGTTRNAGKSRSQYEYERNIIARNWNDKIDHAKRELNVFNSKQHLAELDVPSWAKQSALRQYGTGSGYETQTPSSIAKGLYDNYLTKAESGRLSSIKNAQSNAIKAAEQYSVDVTGYSKAITNFGGNDLRQMSISELKRRSEIKPTPLKAVPTFNTKPLQQAKNRPTVTGVSFDTKSPSLLLRQKEQKALSDFYDQWKSPTTPPPAILEGVVEQSTGKPVTKETQNMIMGLTTPQKPFTFTRSSIITDTKTGESLNTKTGYGSFKIASAIGYTASQDMQQPSSTTETKSESITLFGLPPIPAPKTNQKLFDRGIEKGLQLIEGEHGKAAQSSVGALQPYEIVKSGLLEGGKEVLATAGFMSNIWHEKVETLNFRGKPSTISPYGTKIDYSTPYAFLGTVGKSALEGFSNQSTLQFDKPKVESMNIPHTFLSTAIENPMAVPAYLQKYGVPSGVVGVGSLAIGAGKPSKAKWESLKIAFKKQFKITEVPTINPATNKIYPEIRLQQPITIKQANIKNEIPIEVAFTKTKVSLDKTTLTAPNKVIRSNKQPTSIDHTQWDVPAKIPKGKSAPIKPNDLNTSLADKAGKVPSIVPNTPIVNVRKSPVPNAFERWDVPAKIPKGTSAPIKPHGLQPSLPDKAGKVPNIVPNTPVVNLNVTPLDRSFARWDVPAKIPKGSSAPITTTGTRSPYESLSILPSTKTTIHNTPLIKNSLKQPINIDHSRWNVPAKIPKTNSNPPISIVHDKPMETRLGNFPLGFDFGKGSPRIQPLKVKPKPQPDNYLDNMPSKRSQQIPTITDGVSTPSLMNLKSKAFTLKNEVVPVKPLTKSHAPSGINYTPDKLDLSITPLRSTKAPVSIFKGTSNDLTRKIPKGKSAPTLQPKPIKALQEPTYDEYLINLPSKRSSKIPKITDGVLPKAFGNTEVNLGAAKGYAGKVSPNPLDKLKNEFKINVNVPKAKPKPKKIDEPKPTKQDDDLINQQSKGSQTIQIMKPEGTKPPIKKKKQVGAAGGYDPDGVAIAVSDNAPKLPSNVLRDKPTLPTPTPLSLSTTSAKPTTTTIHTTKDITKYGTIVTPAVSIGSISIHDVKPKTNVRIDTRSMVSQSSKTSTASRSIEQYKPIQIYEPKAALKPKQVQKQQLKSPVPSKAKPKARTIFAPIITPKHKVHERVPHHNPLKTKRTIPIVTDDNKKKRKTKTKKQNKKLFIGNVSETQVVGVYNRKDVTRGKKKVKKLKELDFKTMKTIRKKSDKIKIF